MTDKHRERVAEIVQAAIDREADDLIDWMSDTDTTAPHFGAKEAAERIHALYSREGAEPVAWMMSLPQSPSQHVEIWMAHDFDRAMSRVDALRSVGSVVEIVPLYTAPPESRLRKALEEIADAPLKNKTGEEMHEWLTLIARRALSDTQEEG